MPTFRYPRELYGTPERQAVEAMEPVPSPEGAHIPNLILRALHALAPQTYRTASRALGGDYTKAGLDIGKAMLADLLPDNPEMAPLDLMPGGEMAAPAMVMWRKMHPTAFMYRGMPNQGGTELKLLRRILSKPKEVQNYTEMPASLITPSVLGTAYPEGILYNAPTRKHYGQVGYADIYSEPRNIEGKPLFGNSGYTRAYEKVSGMPSKLKLWGGPGKSTFEALPQDLQKRLIMITGWMSPQQAMLDAWRDEKYMPFLDESIMTKLKDYLGERPLDPYGHLKREKLEAKLERLAKTEQPRRWERPITEGSGGGKWLEDLEALPGDMIGHIMHLAYEGADISEPLFKALGKKPDQKMLNFFYGTPTSSYVSLHEGLLSGPSRHSFSEFFKNQMRRYKSGAEESGGGYNEIIARFPFKMNPKEQIGGIRINPKNPNKGLLGLANDFDLPLFAWPSAIGRENPAGDALGRGLKDPLRGEWFLKDIEGRPTYTSSEIDRLFKGLPIEYGGGGLD